jgi:Pyruvate/2-oxoacid:ferredoxin oxidoreductase gamma subunit
MYLRGTTGLRSNSGGLGCVAWLVSMLLKREKEEKRKRRRESVSN